MRTLLTTTCLMGATLLLSFSPPPRQAVPPLSTTDAAFALYIVDLGRAPIAGDRTGLVLGFWPDGRVFWSEDLLRGGAPYREGHIPPDRISELLGQVRSDGLFDRPNLERYYVGPDAAYSVFFLRDRTQSLSLRSWHELYEQSGKVAATSAGLVGLEGRNRWDLLEKEDQAYLVYRLIWSDLETRLLRLLPAESAPAEGRFVPAVDGLVWDPTSTQGPGAASPR